MFYDHPDKALSKDPRLGMAPELAKLRWGRAGQGLASLHAKTFAFDRRTLFAGSYNLTPRSKKLNMEMGVFLDSPALATRLPAAVEPILDTEAYRLVLEGDRLVWVTQEGGREVRYYHDPETSYGRRLKVGLMGLLPIEGLL